MPAATATWRASIIRKTVPSSRFLGLGDCLPLLDHAREPNDDASLDDVFLDETLQSIAKGADISAIRTFLEDTSKLNSKSPNADIQRYCNIILSSSASAVTDRDFYDPRDMRGFLQHHLSVAEPAIEEAKAQAKKRKAADGTSGDKKKGSGGWR
jgi:hypothetical protein